MVIENTLKKQFKTKDGKDLLKPMPIEYITPKANHKKANERQQKQIKRGNTRGKRRTK